MFSDWKAKEGECKKCSEGGGGPIVIEGKCKPKSGHSCKGLKNMKEVDKCVEYCNAGRVNLAQSINVCWVNGFAVFTLMACHFSGWILLAYQCN